MKKYRYLKAGETTRKSDKAKHKCGSYFYETVLGHPDCKRKVDEECADHKCYKRLLSTPTSQGER